jgi:D-glycero-D-manno-heptose 1,7-bisphosphate phosphatase
MDLILNCNNASKLIIRKIISKKIGNMKLIDFILHHYSKFNFDNIIILLKSKNTVLTSYNKKLINGVLIRSVITNQKNIYQSNKIFNYVNSSLFLYTNIYNFFDINLNSIIQNKKNNTLKNKSNKKILKFIENKNKLILFKKKINSKNKKKFNEACFNIKKNFSSKGIKNHFFDLSSEKDFFKFEKYLKNKSSSIFLDRDGTINIDYGFVFNIKKLKLISKTIIFLKQKTNSRKFIVSNQSGIGRGYFTEKQMIKFYQHLKYKLSLKNILIDDYLWCPHHVNAKIKKYKKNCHFRKPNNGMIKELIYKWNLNPKKSLMIGDQITDQQCAKNSKIKFKYTHNIS